MTRTGRRVGWLSTLTFLFTLLLLAAPLHAEDRTWFTQQRPTQIDMLRTMFRLPVQEWSSVLEEHRDLLDEKFFTDCGKRIAWGLQNGHLDDAYRFTLVNQLATSVVRHHSPDDGTNHKANITKLISEVSPQRWPGLVRGHAELLSENVYDELEEMVKRLTKSQAYELAEKHALLGDLIAAELGWRGELRELVGERVPGDYRFTVPMDIDPRLMSEGRWFGGRIHYIDPLVHWRYRDQLR